MKVILEPGQNILDILLREQGTIEGLFEFSEQNEISITEECPPGTRLEIEPKNNAVTGYYNLKRINPATNKTNITEVLGGINYMGLELDFMVS